MAMRKTALLSLLGLVLMAVTLVQCERRIVSRDRTVPFIPAAPPTPANSIIVSVAGTASDLIGVKVVLLSAGIKIDSAVIASADIKGATATVQFDSVAGAIPVQATYQVNLRHSTQVGFTFQSQLVSITGPTIPVVAFTLRKIENTNTIQVVSNVTVDQSAVTLITVSQPPAVTSTAPTAAPAKVTIAAGSGVTSVSVSTQTAEEVPAIVQNNVMTQAVIGAIQIQTLTPNANATFSVNIPLPISSADLAKVGTNGYVDVLRYDVGTGSWTKIGTYKIRSDGTVQVDDIKGIDENTIISIGSTPGISEAKQESLKTEPVLDVNQTEALKRRGDSTVTYDLSPKISGSTRVGKLALPVPGLPRIALGQPLPAPPAIPEWAWPNIRNYIGNRYPALADWLNTGNTSSSVKLPEGTVEVLDNGVIRRITYQITFGNLKYTFTIEINVKEKVIRFLWHGSGVIS